MGKIGYVVESDFFERTEFFMDAGIMVFTGLNSTFKSIAARTFLLSSEADGELYKPNFLTIKANVVFTEDHVNTVASAKKALIPDSRLVTRALLSARNQVHEALSMLEDIGRGVKDEITRHEIDVIREKLYGILKTLGLSFLEELVELKSKASMEMMHILYDELALVVKGILEELKEEFKDEEHAKNIIMPLVVSLLDTRNFVANVLDKRFKKDIEISHVSTSIIAPLLFEYVTAFLSYPGDKILVIEEPEESMTPLQQAVFARYFERIIKKSVEVTGKKAYAVITTHSPYITYAFSKEVPIKFFNYSVERGKVFVEDRPLKSFALAELILVARAVSEE